MSIDKCCVLSISKGCTAAKFYINNTPLPVVDDCRDLGITVTKDLSPSKYISDIAKKAHCTANMIHRCYVSQNVGLTYVVKARIKRQLLEYNSVIWCPSLKRDIQDIEQVQRRFTKRLRAFHGYSYTERLQLLNILTRSS